MNLLKKHRPQKKYVQPPLTRRDFLKVSGFMGVAVLGTLYPVMIERYLIGVNTYHIPLKRLPPAFDGFTIVQLADIHYGALTPMQVVSYVVRKANALPKDIIVNTGDNVLASNTPSEVEAVWPTLMGLSAPQGVFSVLGNHDHMANTERSQYWLERSGQNLRHKVTVFERNGQRLWLGGTGDLWEDRQSIDEIFAAAPADECKLVLAHNPDSIKEPFQTQIDLMISGHMHGGHFRLPIINRGHPLLISGMHKTPRATLFVSRGIGWSLLPYRFNCPPEVAVLVLERG